MADETTMPPEATAGINAALANPKADIAQLDELEEHLFALRYALGEISTFGDIVDPPKTTDDRGAAMAVLGQDMQRLICAPEVGDLLDRLDANSAVLDDIHKAQVKIMRRDRDEILDVPPEEQAALTKLQVEAGDVWHKAKLANDWESFEPYVDKLVEMQLRIAGYKDADKDPYDVWLNDYEHGSDRAFYDAFFEQVKETVVPLLTDVVKSPHQISAHYVEGKYDAAKQIALSQELLDLEGIDKDAFWLGQTEHPFMGGPAQNFVVIGTHVFEDSLLSGIYSILHEGGHALYEQNVDPRLNRTVLAGGTSSGMHEAQSRFFENIIGRSRPFMEPLLALLRAHYPGRLNLVTANQLFQAANVAAPSLIRTEADELTYPLHIIVRYEIEQALFAGEAKAADIPGLWAEKYKGYLGVDVPDHTRGALQDVHWSFGGFGYFPTYALGNAYGAQLRATMLNAGVMRDEDIAAGDLSRISAWLRDNIWRHGRMMDSPELIEKACGEPFSAHWYCEYLTEKFSALYQL